MNFKTKLAVGLILAGMSVSAAPVGAFVLDEMVIDYRQQIMKAKDAQATAIGHILTGTVPNDNIVSHFESLLLATRQTREAFETKVQGGDALPAIWEDWDDFSAKLDAVESGINVAIEAINKNGPGAAGDVALGALGCKGCHDTYRKK
tara:strand:+ start:548 stop:991 length:444 start_codon:yes stop_codon:yes gene_type:complete